MTPESLNVAVRPRHPYEAADLGIRLVRAHASLVYGHSLLLMLPLLLASLALEHLTHWNIAMFLVWWLKPLYDYAMLWLLSRLVFGVVPTRRQLLQALPSFYSQGLLGALFWRRFSFSRAYLLPARMLEGQSGRELERRIQLLRRNATGKSRALHQLFSLYETIALFALLSFLLWFSSSFFDFDSLTDMVMAPPATLAHDAIVGIYALAVFLVEPLYVAAGFMLYLNRRTVLEAWDVEISLRRLAGRLDVRRAA